MNCQYCGKPLPEGVMSTRMYCSTQCKDRAKRGIEPPGERACAQCGKTFIAAGRQQKYCSAECRAEAMKAKAKERHRLNPEQPHRLDEIRVCPVCGKEFQPWYKGQIYCSRECDVKRRKDGAATYRCKHCRKLFHPKGYKYTTFCSRECAYAYRKERSARHIAQRKEEQQANHEAWMHSRCVCIVCGKEFEGRPDQKYCSSGCRKAMTHEKYLRRFVSVRATNPYVTKRCKHCGKEFTVNFMADTREFCSRECMKHHGKRQRRARQRKQFVEEVSLAYIYERDGGRCQLCGKQVNMKYKPPHPMSATLDHIVPLARGGLHERSNVQLAHYGCNSRKGTGGNDQLRLFG